MKFAEWLWSSLARIGRKELLLPSLDNALPKGNRSPTGVPGCPWASWFPTPPCMYEIEVYKRKLDSVSGLLSHGLPDNVCERTFDARGSPFPGQVVRNQTLLRNPSSEV